MGKEKVAKQEEWYRLDNAAKIYPAVKQLQWSSLFRFSVSLTSRIDPVLLQQALDRTIKRFPVFSLRLKRGLFWYYFERNENRALVGKDVANPCMPIRPRENDGFMFRVRYYENRIALEVFHAITDGTGGLIFLKTLTAEYLKMMGVSDIACEHGVFLCDEQPDPEEMEDGFKRYYTGTAVKSRKEARAYQISDVQENRFDIRIVTGLIPLDRMLEEARGYGVSLTEYLVALEIQALCRIQERERRKRKYPVKISVPINLRQYFPSKTMRNFSSFINVGIDPNLGEYDFEEIVRVVHHYMRYEVTGKQLGAWINKNVKSERNWAIRAVPLFVKNMVLSLIYSLVGETRFSCVLTNIGSLQIPEGMRPYVVGAEMMLGVAMVNKVSSAMISYGNTLSITFTRNVRDAKLEREFFRALVQRGIPVEVFGNDD
ncbi:MAG: hypothetical protein ACOYI4_01435 [Christensenellales bacterium]